MRRATAFWRAGKYFVHASSRTTDGLWILCEPVFAISENEDAATLGRKLAAALGGSRLDVPAPSWKGLLTPLLTLSGVKSWTTFSKNASCVEVEEEGGRVALMPTRNLGPKEGFARIRTEGSP